MVPAFPTFQHKSHPNACTRFGLACAWYSPFILLRYFVLCICNTSFGAQCPVTKETKGEKGHRKAQPASETKKSPKKPWGRAINRQLERATAGWPCPRPPLAGDRSALNALKYEPDTLASLSTGTPNCLGNLGLFVFLGKRSDDVFCLEAGMMWVLDDPGQWLPAHLPPFEPFR